MVIVKNYLLVQHMLNTKHITEFKSFKKLHNILIEQEENQSNEERGSKKRWKMVWTSWLGYIREWTGTVSAEQLYRIAEERNELAKLIDGGHETALRRTMIYRRISV